MADLITLSEYKTAQGINGDTDDARLTPLIASVSALIKTYCSRSFNDYINTSNVEVFNILWDSTALQLNETPVLVVASVEVRDSYAEAYTTLTTGAFEYFLDTETDTIHRTDGAAGFKFWPKGPGAVQITYTAGYVKTPEDLKLAAVDLVTYYHKDEYKPSKNLAGGSMTNATTSTQNRNVSFPDHIKRVLDLYKNFS
jgi:hypothetical protein